VKAIIHRVIYRKRFTFGKETIKVGEDFTKEIVLIGLEY